MTTTTTAPRTREAILAELANLRAHAGRMTVKSPGYARLHESINDLLTELEEIDPAQL